MLYFIYTLTYFKYTNYILSLMSYQYNKWRIKEFAENSDLTPCQLGRAVGITNLDTVSRWMEGSIPSVEVLVRFANRHHVPLLEFFSENGEPMHKLYSKVDSKVESNVDSKEKTEGIENSISTIEHIKEIARMEKEHLKELMQKDIDLAKKEVEMTDRIREKIKGEFNEDKQQIIESYESRLSDRDATIAKLQQQLAELTLQYKELEAARSEKSYVGYGGVTGLAEPSVARK